MSIEIVEESIRQPEGDFLPPCVKAVRRLCRNPLCIITGVILVLASAVLTAVDFAGGILSFLISLLLLVASIVMFKSSGNIGGGYGLKFQTVACLISAVVMAAFALITETGYADILLQRVSNWVNGLTDTLPKPLDGIVNHGFSGVGVVAAALAVCFLFTGLSFGSLKRSNRKNLPFSKVHFLGFLVNILLSAWLTYDGLARILHIPYIKTYEYGAGDLKLSRYTDAALCFAFALFLLLQAVCCLIVYIKMRKVRKCCFQANRNMNI